VEVVGKDDTLLIFDAGTGIRELGDDLLRRSSRAPGTRTVIEAHIFISHFHWDHVQGFSFFAPAFIKGNKVHLYGACHLDSTLHTTLRNQLAEPNWPIGLEDMEAQLQFHDLNPGDEFTVHDLAIRVGKLNHPGGGLGYRVENQGKSLVYASDTEHLPNLDPSVLDLARDCDVLIYDSMYVPEQYQGLWDGIPRESWGHSTWEAAVALARAANVNHLVLFHHGNEDSVVEENEKKARERFPRTTAAYEGLEITL
jgi:phosphoribosyl 1,2-cyclic phosphodiesterase